MPNDLYFYLETMGLKKRKGRMPLTFLMVYFHMKDSKVKSLVLLSSLILKHLFLCLGPIRGFITALIVTHVAFI